MFSFGLLEAALALNTHTQKTPEVEPAAGAAAEAVASPAGPRLCQAGRRKRALFCRNFEKMVNREPEAESSRGGLLEGL